ncbi:DNA-directed RNA polymerase [Candidatus Woesearchaeota archaeon CG10_big_fil_rev_8_21_14_0_10_34_8]|nr:MAG: DNA-directed RNA polymerase [Candidatus Woesearchaeota archaeon CG10_big_fil_rev_8_21_14_0_10_34_8]
MFYKTVVNDYVRVDPTLLGLDIEQAIVKQVKKKYDGYMSRELGVVVDVCGVKEIKEGIIIPGDGAPHYQTQFELLVYRPEMQEVVMGRIKDIADFGAFLTIGPIEGMVHVSQTMDDFVSFSKEKVLVGKETKRTLKVGDVCKAKLIAVSFKDPTNPKLGLTMRQPGLGKIDWSDEEKKEAVKKVPNKK